MKPKLPRELLWCEVESMDEFFELEPVNEDLYSVFIRLREEPFAIQADPLKVFNEVYYQATRLVNEKPMPHELKDFENDVKANMGWKYSSDLVISMAYWLLQLSEDAHTELNTVLKNEIRHRYMGRAFWEPFRRLYSKLAGRKVRVQFHFHPRPTDPSLIKTMYINWEEVTHHYKYECIEDVLDIFEDYPNKMMLASFILESCMEDSKKLNYDVGKLERLISSYLRKAQDQEEEMMMRFEPYATFNTLGEEIEALKQEKLRLERRVAELETENEKLRSFGNRSTKAYAGEGRSFTLALIVDYCKKRIDWSEVNQIVAMLNRLLRGVVTDDDAAMVDSIEEEFKNRVYGTTHIANQNVFPHVENYQPHIDTQTNHIPAMPLVQEPIKIDK